MVVRGFHRIMSEKKYCFGHETCSFYNSWPDYYYDLIEAKCQYCEDYRTSGETAK